jgi:hypothetical protein
MEMSPARSLIIPKISGVMNEILWIARQADKKFLREVAAVQEWA